MFFGGNPVTILDEHTETLLKLNADFRMVTDEKELQTKAPEAHKELYKREILTVKNKGGRPRKVH